jgi:hypothetical protein
MSDTCVTCRAHRTECIFPDASDTDASRKPNRRGVRKDANSARRRQRASQQQTSSPTPESSALTHGVPDLSHHDHVVGVASPNPAAPGIGLQTLADAANVARGASSRGQYQDEEPLELGSVDENHHDMHIVGPAVTNDSQVLSDYLSGIPGATRSTRMVFPESASRSRPVLFTRVQKRPVGLVVNKSPSAEKLAIIEKILEPYIDDIINEYVTALAPSASAKPKQVF